MCAFSLCRTGLQRMYLFTKKGYETQRKKDSRLATKALSIVSLASKVR